VTSWPAGPEDPSANAEATVAKLAKKEAMPQELDELSAALVAALFEQFLRIVDTPGSERATVNVSVPQAHTGCALVLSTDSKQISISFDQWHTHIGPFLCVDIEGSVLTVMTMITELVEEARVVEVVHRDGKWLHSGLCYRAVPRNPEPNATTKTHSWLGTYDNTVTIP
jgi:hypothetical protein